jgi:hypothetical protein
MEAKKAHRKKQYSIAAFSFIFLEKNRNAA